MRPLREFGVLLLARLRPSEWQRVLFSAAVVGVGGALATIGFRELLAAAERTMFHRADGLVMIASGLPWWQRLFSPALGGIVAGLLLTQARRLAERRSGSDYMEAISLGDGDLPVRVSLLRALSSAATVSTGGAIGREGPMVQLAALTGSLIGRWRRAPVPRRRLLVACGAAAGVATAYHAPIASALFVAEIVLHSLALESIGPLLVAAVAAHLVAVALTPAEPLYRLTAFVGPDGAATLLLASIGIVAGLAAPVFLWVLDRGHALFRRWPAPLWQRLGVGGLIVGALSLASPGVWGNGYSVIAQILHGGWVWQALLLVLVLKVVAVAATTGSGAVGGVFTPTLFVGAAAGALCATALHTLWPGAPGAAALAAVGMGAFLAACTHAPLMSVLMIFEMTENYGVVVPSMLACVLAYSISRTLRRDSIYSEAAGSGAPTPALTLAADFLHPQCPTVRPGATLAELEAMFLRYRWQHVYVVGPDQRFLGAIPLYDVAALRHDAGQADRPWPASLLRDDYPRVRSDTPVWQVLETFSHHSGERLPVLDPEGRLTGHVTKSDLVLMFREKLTGH
ncbi:MAG: ClcB-like voltage-gated chloride channel protein [Burkholderiales bacterium]|nr:ClcB-like voltage-gated chloride channel protein [Burkholderiales bacterium]